VLIFVTRNYIYLLPSQIFYQSHETRTTQWTHPLQPPPARQQRKKKQQQKRGGGGGVVQHSRDDASALHRTAPAPPAQPAPSAHARNSSAATTRN
jgi:hypothetical protein